MGDIPKYIRDVLPERLRDKNLADLRGKFAERAQVQMQRRAELKEAGEEFPEHSELTHDQEQEARSSVTVEQTPTEVAPTGQHPVDAGQPVDPQVGAGEAVAVDAGGQVPQAKGRKA